MKYSLIKLKARALTLVELLLVSVMFTVMIAVSVFMFRVVALGWSFSEKRSKLSVVSGRALEEMVNDLREAMQVGFVNDEEVRFTPDESVFYIYYLYNANDSYPPSFNQQSYQLRKA
ncbi:MAG: hypothetical protein ABIB11_03225, partial [Candidatus Omnitrophota bacterium]